MDDGPIATAKVCCFSLQNLSAVPGGKYWSDMPLCFKSVMKHHFQMSHTLLGLLPPKNGCFINSSSRLQRPKHQHNIKFL